MKRIAVTLICIPIALLVLLAAAWAALALWFRLPMDEVWRGAAAALCGLAGLLAAVSLFSRRRWWPMAAFLALLVAVGVWWQAIKPASQADWAPEVARQVTGTINGDMLTLTNIRDFEWKSATDVTQNWTTKSYDLTKLRTLDIFLSYWGSPYMSHVMMSFGFEGGEYLTWSVEVRRLKGGVYSPIADMFKTDPLVIVASDERDVVGVRAVFRGEDVQLYRMKTPPEVVKSLLLEYVQDANALTQHPRFYNSLTTNCATTVFKMARAAGDKLPFDWQLIVDGYLPGYLYAHGALDSRVPLAELVARSHIDSRAQDGGLSPSFSERIRVGVPSPYGP
ncbi:DUF4105 domain-containing protein [Aestuariivirga sp.]|uniref:Lnb N-terminal periplasmic domain-containing protein n=1 Tax=Aestuariivirga sp. TaxID=2650926 RepID=UPI003BA9D3E1